MAAKEGAQIWRNIRYGGAAFALGMPTIPLLVHLPALYAEEIGVGLTATGIALFAARLLDVFTDPIIGAVSDRVRTRWGRRKPFILAGGLIGAAGTVFLLNPAEGASALYLGLWASVLYLGWTLINIPYLAWGADLSQSYNGRSMVTGIRETSMLLGILAAGAVPAILATNGISERDAISVVAWGVIGLGIILFAILLKGVDEALGRALHQTEPVRPALRGLWQNRPFRLLLGSWFINSLANGIPAVLFLLYMKHVLGADELVRGVLTFVYFLAGIAGVPFWLWLSRRWGKDVSWCAAMGVACAAFVLVPAFGQGDILPFLAVVIVTGICLGADLTLPPSMQADVAEYEYFKSKRDRTGLIFSAWSMSTKLALAFSALIAFPLLEWAGTVSTNASTGTEKTYDSFVLAMIYAGLPVVLKISAIALMWRHPLDRARQSILQRRLSALEARQTVRE